MITLNNAQTFLKVVDRSAALQERIDAANWDSQVIVSLAAAQGFHFSEDELQTAIDETWGVLSEEELVNAAGGGNGNGVVPPGQEKKGDVNPDGTWSPPPGDVSGNSCLFGWKNKC